MKKNFKQYLKLTKSQKKILDKTLSLCNFAYNLMLKKCRERDKNKQPQLSKFKLIKSVNNIKSEYQFLKNVFAGVLQEIAKSVYKNWQAYLKRKAEKGNKAGYPRFKKHHRYNSFTYPCPIEKKGCGYKIDNSPLSKKKEARKLELSFGGVNRWYRNFIVVKIILERDIRGIIKTLTIQRKNGKYYACFSCELELKALSTIDKKVGIDLNLEKKSYITVSDGTKYKHPKTYKKAEKKLIAAQRKMDSKIKGSQNWKGAKLLLAKKWEKAVNQSHYETWKIVNELIENHNKFAVENLQIGSMVKDNSLSKHIYQARWGIFVNSLARKAEEAGGQLVRINPESTTQICSDCGELVKQKLTLNQRIFKCFSCRFELDRDINAARNILNRAIAEKRFD